MLVWDNRQSKVSWIGASIACGALAALFLNRDLPLWWFLSLIPAGILFYSVNMLRYLKRKRWASRPFPDKWRRILYAEVPYYRALPEEKKGRFEREVYIFIQENRITGIKNEPE